MEIDILIVGAGLVGSSLAAALADSGLKLALIESRPPPEPSIEWDTRIYTLSPASVAFLESAGAWWQVDASRTSPVHAMQVFGDDHRARLDFSAYETGVAQLGTTVESGRLQHALWQGLKRQRNLTLFCPATTTQLRIELKRAVVQFRGGETGETSETIAAKLVVGADGADSWVRRSAGISAVSRPYGQQGVVANFFCERGHRNIARQWFRHDGILAWLPLAGNAISIVWSTPKAHARELLALGAAEFCARVSVAGGDALGRLELMTPAAAFPLAQITAKTMVQPRVTLIGDAAHVVHPLAGQGVNLGFGDAQALAEIVAQAKALGDAGDISLLRRFERSRAEDILAMRLVTDGLVRLFGMDHPLAARLRNAGLNLTNAAPVIKTSLARLAVGFGGHR